MFQKYKETWGSFYQTQTATTPPTKQQQTGREQSHVHQDRGAQLLFQRERSARKAKPTSLALQWPGLGWQDVSFALSSCLLFPDGHVLEVGRAPESCQKSCEGEREQRGQWTKGHSSGSRQ